MINYTIAKNMTTQRQLSKAWSEYTEKIKRNYQEFINQVQIVFSDLDITSVSEWAENKGLDVSDVSENDLANQYAMEIISSIDFNDYGINSEQTVIINGGALSFYEFLRILILKEINEESVINNQSGEYNLTTTDMNVKRIFDRYQNHDISSIFEELNATLHATVVDNAIARAFTTADSIRDRISVIRDTICETFNNSYSDVSGYLEQKVELVKQNVTLSDIISSSLQTSGINGLAESDSDDLSIMDFDDAKFTGASPASAQCFSTLGGFIGGTLKTAAIAAKSIISGVANIGKFLGRKIFGFLRQVLVNPYDISKINGDDGNHTIETYKYTGAWFYDVNSNNALSKQLDKGPIHLDFLPCEIVLQKRDVMSETDIYKAASSINILTKLQALCQKYDISYLIDESILSLTVKLCNHFNLQGDDNIQTMIYHLVNHGEYEIALSDILSMLNAYINYYVIKNCVLVFVKIKPVSFRNTKHIYTVLNYDNNGQYLVQEVIDALSTLSYYPNSYADVDDNEVELYNSFIHGYYLTQLLVEAISREPSETFSLKTNFCLPVSSLNKWSNQISQTVPSSYLKQVGMWDIDNDANQWPYQSNPSAGHKSLSDLWNFTDITRVLEFVPYNHQVTNASFLDTATCVGGCQAYDINSYLSNSIDNNFNDWNVGSKSINRICDVMVEHFQNEIDHPLDFEFLPYNHKGVEFDICSFEIKTDSRNANAFTTFITTVIVVAAVATVSVVAIKLIRRKASQLAFKRQGQQAYLSRVANGEIKEKVIDEQTGIESEVVRKLTSKDIKTFNRLNRKTNKLAKLSGNLTNGVTSLASQSSQLLSPSSEESDDVDLNTLVDAINENNVKINRIGRLINVNFN